MLYDDEFIESLPDVHDCWKAPMVAYVAREATSKHRSVKDFITKWYDKVPDAKKPEYYSRLRSTNDKLFQAQVMEFYVADSCDKFGEVEFDPVLDNGKTPDILWQLNGSKVLVDVITLNEREEDYAIKRELEKLIEYLAQFEHRFDFGLSYESFDKEKVKPSSIKKELLAYFDELNPETVESSEAYFIEVEGFTGTFYPYPKENGTIDSIRCVSLMGPAITVKPLDSIRNRIRSKVKKYKSWEGPIIVAVCKAANFGVDWDNVASILYGDVNLIYNIKTNTYYKELSNNGGIVMPSKSRPPQNTSLSGVLHCSLDWKPENPKLDSLFLKNPFANEPVTIDIPSYPIIKNDNSIEFKWENVKMRKLGHH